MLTFKKPKCDPETEAALAQVLGIILQAIGLHAVVSTPIEHARFRAGIEEIASRVHNGLPPDELIAQGNYAAKLLEEYNRGTADYLQLPGTEFRSMARMLASSLAATVQAAPDSLARLREIEEGMATANILEEVRQLKMRLAACLETIRNEAKRPLAETGNAVEGKIEVESHAHRADPVTGLAPRKEAEAAIVEACRTPASHFIAVFSMDRVENINLRYGYEVGDNVLRQYTQFLRTKLREKDTLFRWTGVNLVAVLGRPQRPDAVRDEVGRIMKVPLEHTVKTGSRSVMLNIAARWALFNCLPEASTLLATIDSFARSRTGAE